MFIISLLAYTLGFKILSICKIEFTSIQERLVFSIGLGFGILSYLIMCLGFLGLLEPTIAYGVIFVLIISSSWGQTLNIEFPSKFNIQGLTPIVPYRIFNNKKSNSYHYYWHLGCYIKLGWLSNNSLP
ncbi:MAG: hypothetical protein AB1567_07175 [bacterium]